MTKGMTDMPFSRGKLSILEMLSVKKRDHSTGIIVSKLTQMIIFSYKEMLYMNGMKIEVA